MRCFADCETDRLNGEWLERDTDLCYYSATMRNNVRDILLGLHRDHVRAWEQQNLLGLRALFYDEAVIFHTEPPARFPDFKTFENNLNQHFTHCDELSLVTSNIQIEVEEETAWVTSFFLKGFRENGEIMRQSGRWTEIYAKRNGDWKIVHFHASHDPEPA